MTQFDEALTILLGAIKDGGEIIYCDTFRQRDFAVRNVKPLKLKFDGAGARVQVRNPHDNTIHFIAVADLAPSVCRA